jgi:hypothetical protein
MNFKVRPGDFSENAQGRSAGQAANADGYPPLESLRPGVVLRDFVEGGGAPDMEDAARIGRGEQVAVWREGHGIEHRALAFEGEQFLDAV